MRYILILFSFFFFACDDEGISDHDISNSNPFSAPKNFIIAHRGCWNDIGGFPQNSRAAFTKALGLDIYGTEFDVQQTRDGVLVVNHDVTFNGLPIVKSTYEDLCNSTLSNGETIPRLEDFFLIRNQTGTHVKLIIELKACNVEDLINMIDKYQLQEQVEFISFSKYYCLQLVDMGYGYKTFYLGGNIAPSDIKKMGIGGIDYNYSVYNLHPEYITDAGNIGLSVYVWTVNDKKTIINYIEKGVVVTTDCSEEMAIYHSHNEDEM